MSHPSVKNETASAALDARTVARLRHECDGDGGALFRQFVGYFREDLAQAVEAFGLPDLEREPGTLHRAAHQLRGAAGNFGARPLMNICAWMEECAGSDRLPEAMGLIAPLLEEITRVELALEGLK